VILLHVGVIAAARAQEARTPASGAASVCDSVARRWRTVPSVRVRTFDTTATTLADPTAAVRCAVEARADTVPPERWATLYWASDRPPGWTVLETFRADGPDGGSRTVQRGAVRCEIDVRRDGGDDADSTYVPSPAVGELTLCWAIR